MPAYNAALAGKQAIEIGPGQQLALINAVDAAAGNVKTTAPVSLGPTAGFTPTLTLINTTDQTATVAVAAADTSSADYKALTNADTNQAITVATNKAATFTCAAPLLLCTYATAPASGQLTLCR